MADKKLDQQQRCPGLSFVFSPLTPQFAGVRNFKCPFLTEFKRGHSKISCFCVGLYLLIKLSAHFLLSFPHRHRRLAIVFPPPPSIGDAAHKSGDRWRRQRILPPPTAAAIGTAILPGGDDVVHHVAATAAAAAAAVPRVDDFNDALASKPRTDNSNNNTAVPVSTAPQSA